MAESDEAAGDDADTELDFDADAVVKSTQGSCQDKTVTADDILELYQNQGNDGETCEEIATVSGNGEDYVPENDTFAKLVTETDKSTETEYDDTIVDRERKKCL